MLCPPFLKKKKNLKCGLLKMKDEQWTEQLQRPYVWKIEMYRLKKKKKGFVSPGLSPFKSIFRLLEHSKCTQYRKENWRMLNFVRCGSQTYKKKTCSRRSRQMKVQCESVCVVLWRVVKNLYVWRYNYYFKCKSILYIISFVSCNLYLSCNHLSFWRESMCGTCCK